MIMVCTFDRLYFGPFKSNKNEFNIEIKWGLNLHLGDSKQALFSYVSMPETDLIIMSLFTDGGYRSKKRRTSENVEIEDRLESLILRVGEKVR